MKKLLIVVLFIYFASCQNEPKWEKVYYESGQLKSEVEIKDGKKNGILMSYYENGKIESNVQFENNKKNGAAILYYITGAMRNVGNYLNDIKNGTFQDYDENGFLISDINYKDGKKNGTTLYYFKTGAIERYCNYSQDNLIKYADFDTNGNIAGGTPFVVVESNRDTFNLHDHFEALIRLVYPNVPNEKKFVEIILGRLNKEKKIVEIVKKLSVEDFQSKYEINLDSLGAFELEGVVRINAFLKAKDTALFHRDRFFSDYPFSRKFFVKEK